MRKNSTIDIRQRAMEAVARGVSKADISRAYGFDWTTIYRWQRRINDKGTAGLIRKPVSGRPRSISDFCCEDLTRIVLEPASKYGHETDLWTCARLQQTIHDELRIATSRWTVWRRLQNAGMTYKKPEKAYLDATEDVRKAWMTDKLPLILESVRKHKAILYFLDEAHVALTSNLGRTWGPQGVTSRIEVTGKRGGFSAMSAISRQGFLLFQLRKCRITAIEVIEFLKEMLLHHKNRHLVVVMDNAPVHKAAKLNEYLSKCKRLHVFNLPAYSPDWNPDEKVWNHLKSYELKAHREKTTDDLLRLTYDKLLKLSGDPSKVRGIFRRCCIAELLH